MALYPELGCQSFDGLLQSLMQRKRKLAEQALWSMGDSMADVSGLTQAITTLGRGNHAVIADSMAEQFRRDGLAAFNPDDNRAYALG